MVGFPKSERENIKADEDKAFKEAARHVLALTDHQMAALVKKGELVEVIPPFPSSSPASAKSAGRQATSRWARWPP